jgi:hypothetical protein
MSQDAFQPRRLRPAAPRPVGRFPGGGRPDDLHPGFHPAADVPVAAISHAGQRTTTDDQEAVMFLIPLLIPLFKWLKNRKNADRAG